MSGAAETPIRGGSLEAQRERAVETRKSVVSAARAIFAEKGFHTARASDIVNSVSMTRGALYHHFADKEALFEQVFRDVADDLNRRTAASVIHFQDDIWGKVRGAFNTYLELVATRGEFQRILLIDGPAVLGWQRWQDLQSEYVTAGTADALMLLMEQGVVELRPALPLAHLIQAALHHAALSVANVIDSDPQEMKDAFFFLFDRLRTCR